MSLRIDTAEWISGALVIGETGGGVLAENVAHAGTDGDGYLYNDVTLPGDAGKEIAGRITSVPAGLHLFAYEDGSTITSADTPGTYVANYQLYVDYVATGSPTTITYTFGDGSVSGALGWTEGPDTVAIAVNVASTVSAAIGWTEGADTVAIAGIVEVKASLGWTEASDSCRLIIDSGSNASGGYIESMPRRRSVKEERERLGIIPREVKQIVAAVARASVVAEKTDEQAERQLAQRLEQQDIEAKAKYAELMQQERERILSRDIERAMRIKQRQYELDEDDREAEMLLM